MVYCTLFNSNYLDRALVTIKSLSGVDLNAKVYVLCMDDQCFSILNKIGLPNVILIRLSDFEDEKLLSVKSSRSRGEYCWTCTSKLLKYVILHYNEYQCTYIDADLRFYSDPSVLLKEMSDAMCHVQVIPHRFPPNKRGKRREKESGRNCVQFNTFCNEEKSMALLDTWIEQCLDECSVENVGDQKYTDSWSELEFVNVSQNGGAGVAPWNVTRYSLEDKTNMIIKDRYTNKKYPLVFYHFQNLTFPNENTAFILPFQEYWIIDKTLIGCVYSEYLNELYQNREFLRKEFGFCPIVTSYITNEKRAPRISERFSMFLTSSLNQKVEGISGKIRKRVRKRKMYLSFPTNVTEEK